VFLYIVIASSWKKKKKKLHIIPHLLEARIPGSIEGLGLA